MSDIRRLTGSTSGPLYIESEEEVPPLTPLDQVRLEIGDNNVEDPLFSPSEIQYKLDGRGGNILLTAADLCDILATRFAKEYDFSSAARMTFRRSQKSERYEKRAQALRNRAGGLTTVPITRIDGYTDDISSRDGAGANSRTGRVRAGYTDPDLPI